MNIWIISYLTVGLVSFAFVLIIYLAILNDEASYKRTKIEWIKDIASLFLVVVLLYPIILVALIVLFVISCIIDLIKWIYFQWKYFLKTKI